MDREKVRQAALRVAGGERLSAFSPDTLTQPLLCAQFVRQLVEGALALPEGGWPTAVRAREIASRRGQPTRRALDYELAAQELGCLCGGDPEPGDVLYWPYEGFGHTAVYLGISGGQACLIENTNARRGIPVWPGSPVRVTPYAGVKTPRTVAMVSAQREPPTPQATAPRPTSPAGLRNQAVINAFYRAAGNPEAAWAWLESAHLTGLAGHRGEAYSGPAADALPGLSSEQRRRLSAEWHA